MIVMLAQPSFWPAEGGKITWIFTTYLFKPPA
jgi:hypothetical protein